MSNVKAQEGQWYLQRWSREIFCVIAVDEDFRVIDVRDENGDIDEFAFEEWETMDLEACSAPEGVSARDAIMGDSDFDDFEPLNGGSAHEFGHEFGAEEAPPPRFRGQ